MGTLSMNCVHTAGEYLRELRRKRGLSDEMLARAAGYRHGGTIGRIERGALAFPFDRADLLADALGMDRGEFWEKLGRLRMAAAARPPDSDGKAGTGSKPLPATTTPLPRSLVRRLEKMKRNGEIWRKVRKTGGEGAAG